MQHSLALKSDGSIMGWGCDAHDEATPPVGTNFVAIAAGNSTSLALKSDGSIVAWGYDYEDLTTPPAGNDFVAIALGGAHSLALKSDGSIVAWGTDYFGEATPPIGKHFISIDAGRYHSLAISRVTTDNDQRSNLVFCRGGECAPLYADPAAHGSYIGSMELEIKTNFTGRYSAEATPTSAADGTWTAWVEPEVLGPGTVTGTLWVRGENLNLAALPSGSGDVQVAEVDVKVVPAF